MSTPASEPDLIAAFEASPNPYTLLTTDLRYAGMNQAYLDVTRSRREDLMGRSIFEAFDAGPGEEAPENVRQLRTSLEKVIQTGERDHLALIRYAIPVPDPDGATVFEDRYWSATHTPIRDAEGQVAYVLQHTTDITELEHLRRQAGSANRIDASSAIDLIVGGGLLNRAQSVQADNRRLESERNRLMDLFMQAPGFISVTSGPDHVFQLHNAAYSQLLNHRQLVGLRVTEAVPEVAGQGYMELLDTVYATGEPFEGRERLLQLQRTPGGALENVYVTFVYQPIRDEAAQIVGIFAQGQDVTDNVVAAQRQKLMIDELNHRVKNTLATVQSIAIQTARSHQEPATFAEAFQARLMSLSHTHDLLTRSHWEGADLHDILDHETTAHGANRVILNGPRVALGPAAALSLGMIFHELATNAAKYGALSVGDGRVFVDWSVSRQAQRRLDIVWREQDGPVVVEPERRGFGSRLIERNIRHDLAGEVKFSYATHGFNAEISIPLDRGEPI